MKEFSASPYEMFASLYRNKELIYTLIRREIAARYKGSILGIFWSFIYPVTMLAIYTFVFSIIFKARWSVGSDSKAEFALVLFAGLIVFNLFAECINRAPNLIITNTNYVKKVIFPLEILPWVALGSSLFHAFINLTAWLLFYVVIFGLPHITLLLLPIILFPIILITIGVSWVLASLGVYVRDTSQLINIFTTVLMFLSPIFYPVSAIPLKYQPILNLNPLTPAIEEVRNLLIWGQGFNWKVCFIYIAASFLTAQIGFYWFQKTRKGFADVL